MFWRGKNKFNYIEMVGAKTLIGFGALLGPSTKGTTYYVDTDATNADDSNEGTNADYALETVNAAIALCTTNQHDFIYILSSQVGDTTAVTDANDKTRIHIIGLGNPQTDIAEVQLKASSATEDALLCAGGFMGYGEIAGISFGGGATGKGGIGLGQTIGLWIHHNAFGHRFVGNTPDYGIYRTAQANCENTLIEDNIFYGDANNGKGTLAEEAIYMTGPTPSWNLIIRRNIFMGLSTMAVNVSALGGMILDNTFMVPDAVNGEAITIDVAGVSYSLGCLIKGNIAANGMLSSAYSKNPYRDLQTNTSNAWCLNYRGNSLIEPAGV